MATTRGTAKKNILRAKHNADRIQDRLFYLVELYPDYPEWIDHVKTACVTANELAKYIDKILEHIP